MRGPPVITPAALLVSDNWSSQNLLCVQHSHTATPSVKGPRCPACPHTKGRLCGHEDGSLPPWPGTLGTRARSDGRRWDEPGDGSPPGRCSCACQGRLDLHVPKSSGGRCRRRAPRLPELILTDRERVELHEMRKRVLECGSTPVASRSLRPDGMTLIETRKISLTRCGQRWCETCEAAARRYRATRAEGPWGVFVTCTLDPAKISLRRAWRQMPRWVGKLMRAMQREQDKAEQRDVRVSGRARALRDELEAKLTNRDREIPKVLYAWALERHESGFPHAHVVVGCEWVGADWMRKTWRRITGMKRLSPEVVGLTTESDVHQYLTKYITKAFWSIDVCVMLKRKRLFWSAMPLEWIPPKGETRIAADDRSECIVTLSAMRCVENGSRWVDVVEPSKTFALQQRVLSVGRDISEKGASHPLRKGELWEGTELEWRLMITKAFAKRDGLWEEKWWHRDACWLKGDLRAYVIVLAAWFMRHGGVLRWKSSSWSAARAMPQWFPEYVALSALGRPAKDYCNLGEIYAKLAIREPREP